MVIDAFILGMRIGFAAIGAFAVLVLAALAFIVVVAIINGVVDALKGE